MNLYVTDEDALNKLDRVAKRLYREDRLSADDMHDLAQVIDGCVRAAREMPLQQMAASAVDEEDQQVMVHLPFPIAGDCAVCGQRVAYVNGQMPVHADQYQIACSGRTAVREYAATMDEARVLSDPFLRDRASHLGFIKKP